MQHLRAVPAATILTLSLTILASCSPYDAPAAGETVTTEAPACDRACWTAVIERQQNERLYWAEVVKQQKARAEAARIARIYAYAAAIERARIEAARYRPGQCGGSLPPCWVMMRESRGDIRIWNGGCYAPVGWRGKSPCGSSSASGKWQAIRSTWGGYGGYVNAADAPESVQDAWARRLYAGGRGGGHWGL